MTRDTKDRRAWISPAMDSERMGAGQAAGWSLYLLQTQWPELAPTWAQVQDALARDEGSALEDWARILDWTLRARRQSHARQPQDRAVLLDWFCARWPSEHMQALRPVLDYYLWSYASGPIGLRSLGELLGVAFLPRDAWKPALMQSVVRTCMRAGYQWGRPSPALVAWTEAQSFLRDWVAEARAGAPKAALAAARRLWIRAIEGEDMRIVLADLEALCASNIPNVGFFASCALRVALRRKGEDLPPLVAGAIRPKPDVGHKRTWRGMNTEVHTARRSLFRKHAQTPARQKPKAGEQVCGVCASPQTTQIFYESHGGTAWKWQIWEIRCAACGCYSMYWIDD